LFKKSKKTLSLLIVMSIVMSLFAGVATATTNTTFGSGFANVTVGNNRTAGSITATEREIDSWGNRIFMEVRLPEGVTFNARPTAANFLTNYFTALNSGYITFEAASDSMLRVSLIPTTGPLRSSGTFSFSADVLSRLNIAAGVTGNITATVDVHRISGTSVLWLESATLPIARVAPRAVTVTGEAATLVQMGNNRTAARINIQEGAAGSLLLNESVNLEIVTEGVTFATPPAVAATGIGPSAALLETGNRRVNIAVYTQSNIFSGRLEIRPLLNVNPGVTGDIRIRVRGTATDTAVTTTTLTVATIGTTAVEITGATNTGGTIYAGRVAGEVGATATDDARFNLRATGGNVLPNDRIVVLELTNAKFDTAARPFAIESRVGTGGWTLVAPNPIITRFDEDRKAWFATAELPSTATEIRIRDIRVTVDADAVPGDLSVAVSGTIGATGNVVIGRIARAFTATSVATNLTYPGMNQLAGNIVITEAARDTIKAGQYTVNLPEGVAFNESTVKPRVRVTAGDLRVSDTVTVAGRVLTFTVTGESSEASTITIDRVHVDVARAAMEGNLTVGIRGLDSSDWAIVPPATTTVNLAGAVIGRIGDAVVGRASVFTIGALSFLRNGVTTPIDAPPTIVAGRTLLPLRFAALAVGVSEDNILWDPVRRTVTLIGDRVVQLQIGSTSMLINGVAVPLEVAPSISSGRTMLPIRALAAALRAEIVWDGTARTVTVTTR